MTDLISEQSTEILLKDLQSQRTKLQALQETLDHLYFSTSKKIKQVTQVLSKSSASDQPKTEQIKIKEHANLKVNLLQKFKQQNKESKQSGFETRKAVKNLPRKDMKIENVQPEPDKKASSGKSSKSFSKPPKNNKLKMENSMKSLKPFQRVKLNKEMEVFKELIRIRKKVKAKINEGISEMIKMGEI